jgi:formate C-acetyltransferase
MSGKKLEHFTGAGLAAYTDFESFYQAFMDETRRICRMNFAYQDILSEGMEKKRPAYLISSMVDDCLAAGRNMHGGGARYHDYGAAVLGMPNAADSLYAIKKAVFEDKLCTAQQLLEALEADFAGYEVLRHQLLAIPKYGQEDPGADAMAARVFADMGAIYESCINRFGGNAKLVILTFIWSPTAAAILGATPDGRNAGLGIAQGVTPQSSSMTEGISAAINSCGRMPYEKFSGGASSMWDFDSSFANTAVVKATIKTFIEKGGQIFQGNTTPLEDLLKAKENPEMYQHLIVRVGGYSARFVNLDPRLQDDIINRIRHCR